MSISVWRALPVLIILLAAGLMLPASAGPAGLPALFPQLNSPSESRENVSLVQESVSNPDWITEVVDPTVYYGITTSIGLDASGNPRIAYDNITTYQLYGSKVKYAWKEGGAWNHANVTGNAIFPSLAVDVSGNPRIACIRGLAFGSAGDISGTTTPTPFSCLTYLWNNGAGWRSADVDTTGSLFWFFYPNLPSLQLTGAGKPKIGYVSADFSTAPASQGVVFGNLALKLAWKDSTPWQTRVVQLPGPTEDVMDCSLALDRSGNPGIAYGLFSLPGNGSLRYTWKDGTGWHDEVVVPNTYMTYPSLARDGSGRPRICYENYTAMKFVYAWKNGGTWHFRTLDEGGWFLGSLALDSAGNPRIAYIKQTTPKKAPESQGDGGYRNVLKYAWKDGTGWHSETIDNADPAFVSLALDRFGRPSISYIGTGYTLKYATKGSFMGRTG